MIKLANKFDCLTPTTSVVLAQWTKFSQNFMIVILLNLLVEFRACKGIEFTRAKKMTASILRMVDLVEQELHLSLKLYAIQVEPTP
jgi:hypothetical protein